MNKKVIIPNSKLKRVMLSIMMGMLVLFSGILAACDDGANKLKLEASVSHQVLYLDDLGGREASLSVFASGANEDALKDLYITSSSSAVRVSSQKYVGKGQTDFTLTGIAQETNITISVVSNRNLKKMTELKVDVIEPVLSLSRANSAYKPYVVKGSSASLNNALVNFTPSHTFEKELVFEVKNNPAPNNIKIENDRLVVDSALPQSINKVEVVATSAHRQIAGVTLEYAIVDNLSKDSFEILTTPSGKDLLQEGSVLYLERNSSNIQNETISVVVESNQVLSVNAILVDNFGRQLLANSNNSFAQIIRQTYNPNTKTYSFELAPGKEAGQGYIYFEVEYSEYGYKFSTETFKTKVLAYDIIKNIMVNDQLVSASETYKLFSEYAEGFSGHEFVFSALPTTVAEEYRSFYIETLDYNPENLASSKIFIYAENKTTRQLEPLTLTNGKLKIEDGQSIYVLANKDSIASTASLEVVSEFSAEFYSGTEKEKTVQINFDIVRGVSKAEVYGFNQGQEGVVLNSEIYDEQKLYFAVADEDAQLLGHTTYKIEGNFEVKSNSLTKEYFDADITFDTTGKALWSITLKSLADSKIASGRITLNFGNGRSLSVKVLTELEFKADKLQVASQQAYENSAVGFYQTAPKTYSSFEIAVKQGTSAKLLHNLDQKTFGVEYSFINATYSQETDSLYQNISNFEYDVIADPVFQSQFTNASTIIAVSDLQGYNTLSARVTGKVLVKAVYAGKRFVSEGKYQVLRQLENQERVVKYFLVEVYVPIVSFDAKITNNLLYSSETVGFYNRNLSQTSATVSLNNGYINPTYANIQYRFVGLTDAQISIKVSENNNKLFTITALRTNASSSDEPVFENRDGYLEFSVTEFNQTKTVRLPIIIRSAEKVKGIVLENVNEENGIYLHVDRDSSFTVQAKPENLTAYNSKFVYSFEPDIGIPNASDILRINENTGQITLTGNGNGGTGVIKVIPQDAFIVNEYGQKELSLTNTVVKVIKIVVADGRTKQTATQISSLNEIDRQTGLSKHYVLTGNISLNSSWVSLQNFSGGLYGRILDNQEIKQISFNNASALFVSLNQNAIIEDLILVGDVTGSSTGFVANTNQGTINNVVVDTKIDNGQYLPSVLTSSSSSPVGGIVGTNQTNGIVSNSSFFGKIVAQNATYAGGLAGENQGLIENSKVEFYTYEAGELASISSNNVGGIVGNLNNGRIVLSYAYSYHNYQVLVGTGAIGAIVSNVTGANASVSKSFARTNAPYFIGGQSLPTENHTASFNLTNSYHFYYQPITEENQEVIEKYNVAGANKFVALNPQRFQFGDNTFTTNYQSYGVEFGSTSAWTYSLANNKAYPYLKQLLNEQANLNPNLSFVASENLLVDNENREAVFFFYQPVGGISALTQQEQTTIKNWNTYTFAKLFGINNINGIKAVAMLEEQKPQSAIRMLSNAFEIVSTTNQKIELQVFSKYDYTTKISFTISVIYAPGTFALTLENSPVYNNSVVSVKGGTTQVVNASFNSQKVVTTRPINFVQEESLVSYLENRDANDDQEMILSTTLNVHVIDTIKFEGNDYVAFVAYAKITSLEESFNDILRQKYYVNFALSTYKGPFEIKTNVKEIIRAMPYDSISFDVEVVTDNENEKIDLVIKDEKGSDTFVNGVKYNELFTNSLMQIGSNESLKEFLGDGKWKLTYKINLEILDSYKNLNFNNVFLSVTIKSSEFDTISANIDLILASQEIQYINIFARELNKYTTDDGFLFKDQVSSNIAPGKNALLTLDLFPKLAYFDTIEITSSMVNGQRISFSILEKVNEKLQRKSNAFKAVTNGISVNQTAMQFDIVQKELSSLYIYATVPSTVVQETQFTIYINAYGTNKEFLTGSEFIIVAKPLIAANIKVNGEKTAIVAKGTKAEVVVEMEQTQWLGNDGTLDFFVDNTLSADAYYEGISITKPIETVDEVLGKRIYKAQVEVSVLAQFFNTPNHSIDVLATVERRVGNVTETATSSVKIYVVDFLVDFSSFEVKTESVTKDTIQTYIGMSKNIEFDVQTTSWEKAGADFPERNQAIANLEEKVARFKEKNHYFWQDPLNAASKYVLNYHENDANNNVYKNYLNNLYYVNSNGSTTKVLASSGTLVNSDIISFVFLEGNGVASNSPYGKSLRVEGKRTGRQDLRLMFDILNPDGSTQRVTYDFSVLVESYTDEDKPEQIYSAEEFMAIANEQNAQDYILMEDIYLYEYIPFNTSKIKSFDGNNKVISIMSFDLDLEENSSSISLALFSSVNESTTLKNITVNYYHLSKILINTAKFKTVNIAGFAIENRGIITNSHVLANKFNPNMPNSTKINLGLEVVYSSGSTETKISQNISSTISGFVITNASGATITNSRVGGTEFESVMVAQNQTSIYSLRTFHIVGQGAMTGFVGTNSGTISASYSNNINIENQSDVKRETVTSGFVGTNNGKITLSYSKGAYNSAYPNEIRASGSGISTTGIASGFVYTNNGTISDSYSNIMIRDKNGNAGRGSAGFVYNNNSSGVIEKAYTASLTEDRNSSQMNFTGVDENLNILNAGTIKNSYYYSPQASSEASSTEIEELYASGVLKINSFTNLEAFYGFSFATVNSSDGVWKATSGRGIDLVSANEVAISSRYLHQVGLDYVFHYADGYAYGSKNNPIIIRTAEEFNNVLGGETKSTPIKEQFKIEKQEIYGSYRLVSDINLKELSVGPTGDYKLASNGMSFVNGAVFEGNNLIISNLQMYSTLEYNKKNLGLFASVENGAIIKNLNVGLLTIEANNVENVGAITGALIDSKLVNINLYAMASDSSAKILGQNVVGGIVGLVSGNSAVVGLSADNISVEVDFFDRNIVRQQFLRKNTLAEFAHSRLSYAGGLIGILDIFTPDKFGQEEYFRDELMSFATSASLYVTGFGEIKAGTVGGVVGYVGFNTYVRDASYEIYAENINMPQNIVSFKYSAGGIVGHLNGGLTQSRIEHNEALQTQIEENVGNYYNNSQNVVRGNMSLFKNTTTQYSPEFVGGLVGQITSGEISNSYSRANVVIETARFVGGVIGSAGDYVYPTGAIIKRIGNINIEEVYSFGEVRSSKKTLKINAEGEEEVNIAAGAAGFIGFIEYIDSRTQGSNNIPVKFNINGSNAIIYVTKDLADLLENESSTQLRDIYDFYAFTNVDGKFIESTKYFDLAQYKRNNNEDFNDLLLLKEFGENKNSPDTKFAYTTKEFEIGAKLYQLKISQFGIYQTFNNEGIMEDYARVVERNVAKLNEIVHLISDGKFMDVIFRNNYWNENSWERKTGTLLPRIVFTVTNSIFYIEKPEDFLLMRAYPDKIFIIKGGIIDSNDRYLIDMSTFTSDYLNDAIRNFTGLLKGYVEEEEGQLEVQPPKYGFKNLAINQALIESTRNGAVFSDFIISQSGSSLGNADGAILVKDAEGTIFRNILIENSSIKTDANNAGLLVATAENSIFDTVVISSALNRDIIELGIADSNSSEEKGVFSVGSMVGSISSSIKTTFRNVEVTAINGTKGILVSGSTVSLNNTKIKTVNMGGLYGFASQNVEIISDNLANPSFIRNINVKFNSGSTGSGGVRLPDYYNVFAGAIGGRSESGIITLKSGDKQREITANVIVEGDFWANKVANADTDVAVASAVGGAFGHVSGLSIQNEKSFVSDVSILVSNKYETEELNKRPVIAIGGIAGYASASTILNRVEFGTKKINRLSSSNEILNQSKTMIKVTSKNNIVYVGGLLGRVKSVSYISNSKVSSGSKFDIENLSTNTNISSLVVGGVLGESSYSNDSGNQATVSENTFNGTIAVKQAKDVVFGGIVGALSRKPAQISGKSEISQNHFGGQIDIQKVAKSEVVAGGILGSSDNGSDNLTASSNPIEVSGNISYGDINLNNDNIGDDFVVLGGIVGDGSGATTVSNNTSLTTLYTTRSNKLAKAVVGNSIYKGDSQNNIYSSQLNLATDDLGNDGVIFASNKTYVGILNEITTANIIQILGENHIDFEQSNAFGYKLRPYIINQQTEDNENYITKILGNQGGNSTYRVYFTLGEDITLSTTAINLSNKALIADGKTISVENDSARIFNVIDNKAFVSGVSAVIKNAYYPTALQNYQYKYTSAGVDTVVNYPYTIYGGLTAINEGVIFGSNVSAKRTENDIKGNNGKAENFYAEIFLSETTLAGGLVGLNKGFVSDSFTSVNLINITGLTKVENTSSKYSAIIDSANLGNITINGTSLYIRPITSGFVGINYGDIAQSYSIGVINAFESIVYSFGADSKNIKFLENLYAEPTVRNSFAFAQSSNAFKEVEVTMNGSKITGNPLLKTYSNVFGYGANNTNAYDIYATQTEQKHNSFVKKYTTQMFKTIPVEDTISLKNVFEISSNSNFGYPSFGGAYTDFGYMKQITFKENSTYVSNLGVLQNIFANRTTTGISLYLLNDMQVTEDMGYVSTAKEFISINDNTSNFAGSNYEPFALTNANIYGNGKTISGFSINLSKSSTSPDNSSVGFFTEMENSKIDNLILSNGEVVYNGNYNMPSVGGFVGTIKANSEDSFILNSKNLGIRVQTNKGGFAGGLVGKIVLGEGKIVNIDKNINTGNVVSTFDDPSKAAQVPDQTVPVVKGKSTKAISGGIFGYSTNLAYNNIKNNENFGLVYSDMPEEPSTDETEKYYYNAYASGIGSLNNLVAIEYANSQNLNSGLAKVYSGNEDFSETYTSEETYGATNTTSSLGNTVSNHQTQAPNGNGSTEKPFVINNVMEFNFAYDAYNSNNNFNIILNTHINMQETKYGTPDLYSKSYLESDELSIINIYGNNKLLSYVVLKSDSSISNYSFIGQLNENSKITSLNILGHYNNASTNVSLLTAENNGVISSVNLYGSMLTDLTDKNIEDEDTYISGIAYQNNGKIEFSNNYSLLQATGGRDAYFEVDVYTDGTNAVNVGGISGINKGSIIYAINHGALIGGDGGAGYSYAYTNDDLENLLDGDTGEDGEDGKNGTHGGNASLIGGISARVESIDESSNAEEPMIIGTNLGIIIGGRGGNGGDGQKGGNGGDAVDIYIEFYRGVLSTGISNLEATWDQFKNTFIDGRAGNGGGGGAGGNGGNTIAGGISGMSSSDAINEATIKSSANPILISGIPGLGGKGGDGGDGGRGAVSMDPVSTGLIVGGIASILAPPYSTTLAEIQAVILLINTLALNYKNAGNGGGAGGTGFSGNSVETIQNSFFIENQEDYIQAQPGGQETDTTKYGFGSQKFDLTNEEENNENEMNGEYGATKNSTQFLNEIGEGKNLHKVAAGGKGQPAEQNIVLPTVSNLIGFSASLPNYIERNGIVEGYYEVHTWMDLINLLSNEGRLKKDPITQEAVYKLQNNFSFGGPADGFIEVSPIWSTLPAFEGKIDGNGKTIKITGNYSDVKILSSVDNQLKNITIDVDISNFQASVIDKHQFIATPESETIFNMNANNVKLIGTIRTSKTIPWLREKYGRVDLPDFGTTLKFTGAKTLLTGSGTKSDPYKIGSAEAFKEFALLVKETASKAYYQLTSNIVLTPSETGTTAVGNFLGHFDGNGKTIKLNNTEGTNSAYLSLFGSLGDQNSLEYEASLEDTTNYEPPSIINLTIEGAFISAGIANENYGLIYNVIISGGSITSNSNIAGVVGSNFGTILEATNNTNLTSNEVQTKAAGITLTNIGKLLDVTNAGEIKSVQGEAAGITIRNGGLIDKALNTGNVTAGKGGSGSNFDDLEEAEQQEYIERFGTENEARSSLANGGKGNDAAGIAIYNYLEKANAVQEDFFKDGVIENGVLIYGITNVENRGKITAGQGGEALQGGVNGSVGIASGIIVYNYFEDYKLVSAVYEKVVYVGFVQTSESKPVINSGQVFDGNNVAVTDEKLKIIRVNEVTINEITYIGFYDGFDWEDPVEEG